MGVAAAEAGTGKLARGDACDPSLRQVCMERTKGDITTMSERGHATIVKLDTPNERDDSAGGIHTSNDKEHGSLRAVKSNLDMTVM